MLYSTILESTTTATSIGWERRGAWLWLLWFRRRFFGGLPLSLFLLLVFECVLVLEQCRRRCSISASLMDRGRERHGGETGCIGCNDDDEVEDNLVGF